MPDVILFEHISKKIIAKVLPPITDQDSRGSKPSVKISFPQGLVLISIIQLRCKIGCIKSYFVLPLSS